MCRTPVCSKATSLIFFTSLSSETTFYCLKKRSLVSLEEQRVFGAWTRSTKSHRLLPPPLPFLQSPPSPLARQELLAKILRPDARSTAPGRRDGSSATTSVPSQPNVAQVRGVVGPLEQALQIYTDMKNAPQAAACHYQVFFDAFERYRADECCGQWAGVVGAPVDRHGRLVSVDLLDRV